jgi:hypothetical protein
MPSKFRKVFIDSRWRTRGEHYDFDIELPQDVVTTSTSVVYVASCSFSNTFETVGPGNDKLYFMTFLTGGQSPVKTAIQLTHTRYTGTSLASALQNGMRTMTGDNSYIVDFNAFDGKLTFTGRNAQFPRESELRDPAWKAANWDPVFGAQNYDVSDPQSLNAILYFPPSKMQASTTTGNIDLAPYREIYIHSSIGDNNTLRTGLGNQDCLCRVPVTEDFGYVVSYRDYLGMADALSASSLKLRTISFSVRDWAGRLVEGLTQPLIIELVFCDTNPYEL